MEHKKEIHEFIVENFLFGDGKDFTDSTDFFKGGIVDSTGILEIMCFIEETHDIIIHDDDVILDNFSSVNSINNYLENRLAENQLIK